MSQVKLSTKDPNFASKQKLLSERKQIEEIPLQPASELKSEKKCITATKSELKSNKKFKDRMATSREASGEKFKENDRNFTSNKKIANKSTKKHANTEYVKEEANEYSEKKENKDNDNKENSNCDFIDANENKENKSDCNVKAYKINASKKQDNNDESLNVDTEKHGSASNSKVTANNENQEDDDNIKKEEK